MADRTRVMITLSPAETRELDADRGTVPRATHLKDAWWRSRDRSLPDDQPTSSDEPAKVSPR